MKKLFYILILSTGMTNAQIVNIPDANFKAALIENNVDTNNDGNIQLAEAQAMVQLQFTNPIFTNVVGLESFSNLKTFYIDGSLLTSLDLTSLTQLENILFYNNDQLLTINVNGLNNLMGFTFYENSNITSIDLSNLNSLRVLDCTSNNELTSINLNGTRNITNLSCISNNLESLDVSGSNNLDSLRCDNNQISNLNITNCSNLFTFSCSNNLISSLDLSGTGHFNSFSCSNNLIANFYFSNPVFFNQFIANNNLIVNLDLSRVIADVPGGINYYLQENPIQTINMKNGYVENLSNFNINSQILDLQYICSDDNEFVTVNNFLTSFGLTGVEVNSYCSFEPGGNYNTITGTVTFDANNNGCDVTDVTQPNIRVNINDGTNQGATFTNNSGNYTFYTQAGSFDITPNVENPTYFNFSPTTATIPFADNNNNTATQNFCISANGIHPDVEIVIAPVTPARPGFDATYKIVYKNKGNQTLSGNVGFTYDDTVLDFVSATVVPNSQSVGALSWNYTNLLPFESRSVEIVLNVNAPTETPAVNIGDILNFSASVNPIAGDEIPSDNTFNYNETVVGSYDPNDITCLEGALVSPAEIGNYMHYNIRFENTGTAPAEFVVVKVEVNEADFDMNSLQIMNSSNPVYARINRNIVEFIFQNIQLQSGGHGNILLKIKSKNNLQVGDEVNKKADIYFDYNFPIETNDAETVFQSLNNPDFQNDASISVYPNPTNGIVTVNCNNSIKSIELYDVQGRLLQTNLVNENQTSIDISNQAKGVYFLKIVSEKGIGVQKIVRE
jgi:hypothetical protein